MVSGPYAGPVDIWEIFSLWLQKLWILYPNVAKAGGLQSQGVKGEVVVVYHDPLTTQDLKSSGFPEG